MFVTVNYVTATLVLNTYRTIAILLCLAFFALFLHPVFAQDDATPPATARKNLIQPKVIIRRENGINKIDTMKAKMASREAELKARLQTFKDKRKAQLAENVNTNLNKINQNRTAEMQKNLDKMSSLLDKLEARVNQPTPDVKDPAAAKIAIANSRQTIATTAAAVKLQSEKDYTIGVTSESQVKVDAQKMRNQLFTDLQSVRKLMIESKQSVSSAIMIAKSGPSTSSGLNKEGTTSGQQ